MARRTVNDDDLPRPPMTWRERERAWQDRERHLGRERGAAGGRARPEAGVRKLKAELSRAKKRIAELESAHRPAATAAASSPPPVPAFVKPNLSTKARKRPGRKAGHAAALRPAPAKVDQVVDVPLAADARG